ncbi:AarF/ABC1/UbiB kinase family protein [Cyanobacterium stanieri LEGE 03274]|uniref:AarF/ABC1/UbiB kinase family protein n=1 Tax=Cyanobacterium stanieri LEGE 03274 TaxID=1828756 RepID=A0ABR9V2J4_9CHRO|nr:AarF/ABC1/UbiB kinase family protein [Cyanobacterium stanieri]MBE9222120.1 AarF/ABC1/UbiB kinase family protein [Cyanobacterium stanieri LEGE 03274]
MKFTEPNISWERNNYSPFQRQWQIFNIALRFTFYLFKDFCLQKNSSFQRHKRAQWLVNKLIELGPTFIKIGQALSTRPDLIPIEYIDELSKLQDRVPAFSSQEAIALIEAELNTSVYSIYQEFEPIPIAAASLGQVHWAKLRTGEEVVIKVQRKGLDKLFNLDFQVLKQIITMGNRILPGFKKYELNLVYQEFFELLFSEIDYINEGKNAERFRENFKKDPKIVAPKVYWQYTTAKILTLEFLPGIKINDKETLQKKGIALKPLIETGICSYLKQLLEDGFFQTDPHPGNMAVREDGAIIFYDFGTMAQVKGLAQEQMIQTFFAILRKDTDKVLDMLIYMGLIERVSDMTAVKRLISFLLEKFRDKPVDVNAFQEISTEIYVMFEQQPFRLPPQMTFIVKALTTLDGIARNLDPEYNLMAASQPFIKNIVSAGNRGNLLVTIFNQTKIFIQEKINKPSSLESFMQDFQGKLDGGELQIKVRSLETERIFKNIYLALKTILYGSLMGFSLLNAILIASTIYSQWAFFLFGLTGLFALFFLRSIITLTLQERLLK